MHPNLAATCSLLFLIPTFLFGGIPTEETVICPVGGEQFTITGTLSCSTTGRTMSFSPSTSCDFVTKLPVCPSNGLPVYQEFSAEQVSELEKFVLSEEYKILKQLPPWQRAYGVAEHLGQTGSEVAFGILLSAMWYESEAFFESDLSMDQFLAESRNEVRRADAESKPFLEAIVAYALSSVGRFSEANERLERVSNLPDVSQYLLAYVSAIQACQDDMGRKGCRPDDRFRP